MGCTSSKSIVTETQERDNNESRTSHPSYGVTSRTSIESTSPPHAEDGCAPPQALDPANSRVPLGEVVRSTSSSGAAPVQSRRHDWTVQPGYSSGASSGALGDEELDELEDAPPLRDEVSLSRHTSILALSELRREKQLNGNLASTVVRIETPFDTPIEAIYSGVADGEIMGSGVSGIVRLVTHKATGVNYAVKVLDLDLIDTEEGLRQLRNEIFIMCQLDHPNIVRIEEVYESASEIYIVQELCKGGDLFDRLDEQPDYHYTEAQCARLVKQMLSSVRYLHSKGIIHRDLKLENFLFSSSSPTSELKMIDFGLSKHFEIGEQLCEKVGTPYSVSPEIINGSYDEKSDMWAIGVITYLLLSGDTPFGGLDGENLLVVKENIMRAKVEFGNNDVWEQVSDDGKAFVKQLLNADPKKRPHAKEMQRNKWIQVWAKKDAKEGANLSEKTVSALMKFKESSDMQKLLSEVLSFTLLPEQIVDLRKEFEKIDDDGDGQISLSSLKRVLLQNAEAGALGALSEKEVEDIFDSIRVRKGEPTIHWHEFLAAGLSQARVDERNLKLAFDRLDSHRNGYLTYEDLSQIGNIYFESKDLERIWSEGMSECKCKLNRISFEDFKSIMKGQPKDLHMLSSSQRSLATGNAPYQGDKRLPTIPSASEFSYNGIINDTQKVPTRRQGKPRSNSYELKSSSWQEEIKRDGQSGEVPIPEVPALAMLLSSKAKEEIDPMLSPLASNRALYRKHREMRLAVLDASKQFDKKRRDRSKAGLIMRRGSIPPFELDDAHTRLLFERAAHRCGRRTRRKKTVSDVTGMIMFS